MKVETLMIYMSMFLLSLGNYIVFTSQKEFHKLGWILFWCGIVYLTGGVLVQKSIPAQNRLQKINQKLIEKYSLELNQLQLIAGGLISAATVYIFSGDGWMMRNLPTALFLWFFAIVLIWSAFSDSNFGKLQVGKKDLLIGFFLTIVGVMLRLYKLESIPNVLTGDEASMGMHSLLFLQGKANNIFGIGWFSFPSLYYFVQAISIKFFGQTVFALRFLSAIIGGATIGVTYFVGKRLYNPTVGLFASILLLGQHFYLHFSRLGLNNVFDSFWYVFIIFLLLKLINDPNRNLYLILGIALGLSQYFYISARLLIVVAIIWLLLSKRINNKNKPSNQNVFAMIITFLVVFLPLGMFFINHPGEFFAPYNRVKITSEWLFNESQVLGISQMQVLIQLTVKNLKMFTLISPIHWYSPGTGLIRGLSIPFFYLGLVFICFEKWSEKKILLLAWASVIIIPGIISLPRLSSQRFIAIAPLLVIIIAVGIYNIFSLINDSYPRKKNIFLKSFVLFCILISANNFYFYMNTVSPNSTLGGLNTLVANTLSSYLVKEVDISSNAQIAFWGLPRMGYESISTLPFLAPHVEGLTMVNPIGSEGNPELSAEEIIFVLLPAYEEYQQSILQAYPGGVFSQIDFDSENVLYWQYHYGKQGLLK
jgi:4-amino-4-deoxy-L-arabinose transferase-like glycosyltransferase